MNLNFRQINLASAANIEGAVLGGHDKDFFLYTRNEYHTLIERSYFGGLLYVYRTPLSTPLPSGMTMEDIYSEVFAAAKTLTKKEVVWG